MRDFEMIKDGDKVLIALSGGKDSVSLIHVLRHFQSVAPIKFDIGAVTIDPQVYEYNPRPLIPYL
jgi:tRNA 2-thiocytidine biosynthesis protein TtcA